MFSSGPHAPAWESIFCLSLRYAVCITTQERGNEEEPETNCDRLGLYLHLQAKRVLIMLSASKAQSFNGMVDFLRRFLTLHPLLPYTKSRHLLNRELYKIDQKRFFHLVRRKSLRVSLTLQVQCRHHKCSNFQDITSPLCYSNKGNTCRPMAL